MDDIEQVENVIETIDVYVTNFLRVGLYVLNVGWSYFIHKENPSLPRNYGA